MSTKNQIKVSAKQIIWTISLFLFFLSSFFVFHNYISPLWLSVCVLIIMMIAYDSIQSKHAIRRNFPLIGRLRYYFESVRPEFRQYFFEGELDGKPFNRRQRSIVYQRAKNVKQTISFGMQDDPNRMGYEWVAHSIYPKKADYNSFRVTIGNKQCLQPYSSSILNISAMSYGALSKAAITALNKGAMKGKFAHNSGEGGVSNYHLQGADVIWQIGTGYFGCRDDQGFFSDDLYAKNVAHPNIKMVELKLSQGAKPGHGGLLPAEKNTPEIAAIRHIKPFTTVHSPSSHSAFSNATEMLLFINKLKKLSNGKPIGIKICIGRQDEFIEVVKAIVKTEVIPDFITIDGAEGGTGAAPLEFIDYMGMSLTDALVFTGTILKEYGLRDQIKILAAGRIITAFDVAKAISLGADVCYSARGMMFSLGCIQALQCDSGKCPVGIATQNKSLYDGIDITDKSERVANFHKNTMIALADFIGACGCKTLNDITPDMFYRKVERDINKSFTEIYFNKTQKTNT